MAEGYKIHQLPADMCANPTHNSDSGHGNDSALPSTGNDGEKLKTKDPDTVRESKRRKSCPSALDNCEAIIKSCCNSSFSFTFDPKFCSGATTPEVTPKFGSFNLVAAMTAAEIKEKIEEKSGEEENDEEEDEEERDQVIKKRNFVEISVDGLKSAD